MAITQRQLRELNLGPVGSQFEPVSAPQWGNFVLFAQLLVAGLATVGFIVGPVPIGPAIGEEAA